MSGDGVWWRTRSVPRPHGTLQDWRQVARHQLWVNVAYQYGVYLEPMFQWRKVLIKSLKKKLIKKRPKSFIGFSDCVLYKNGPQIMFCKCTVGISVGWRYAFCDFRSVHGWLCGQRILQCGDCLPSCYTQGEQEDYLKDQCHMWTEDTTVWRLSPFLSHSRWARGLLKGSVPHVGRGYYSVETVSLLVTLKVSKRII